MKTFIEKNLMVGEKIIHRTKIHKISFLPSVLWLGISILLLIISDGGALLISSGVVLLIVSICWIIRSIVAYKTSEYGITNKRVIIKEGFIRRRVLEILFLKVESVRVDQGVIARLLSYGNIIISGSGGTEGRFRKVSKPLDFHIVLSQQMLYANKYRGQDESK